VVLNDRHGTLLVPFFQKGHPMQSGKPSASLTKEQAVDLMHFLRQRINDTLRGSEAFDVKDIVTGDAKAGEAYFNGEGKCTACHSITGDFAGLKSRIPAPVDVQQRIPINGGVDRNGQPINVDGWIELGEQKLDGYHALWYARARHGTSDYDRMSRQREVQQALLS
jgi:hypothetical protein